MRLKWASVAPTWHIVSMALNFLIYCTFVLLNQHIFRLFSPLKFLVLLVNNEHFLLPGGGGTLALLWHKCVFFFFLI